MKKLITIILVLTTGLIFGQGPTLANQKAILAKLTAGLTTTNAPSGTQNVSIVNTPTNANVSATVNTGTMNVGGFSTRVSVTPVISASPDYSSGDNVGAIQTVASAVRSSGGTAMLTEIEIWDKAAQNSAFVIDFWDASPSGTYTDNSAEVIAGDDGKYLGSVFVSSADWVTTGAVSRCSIKGLGLILKPASGTSVYATVLTTSVPNQASTSDLIFKYSLIQD